MQVLVDKPALAKNECNAWVELRRGAMQGLNIAPTLIAIAPTKTVVNPVGPLAITDMLVSVTVPALPGP